MNNFLTETFLEYPDNSSISAILYFRGCDRNCKGCQNKDLQKYVINVYDKGLFNYDENQKKIRRMTNKRLWNFLLFAYKLTNKSNTLTASQIATMQKAHDLELDKEEFRPLFNQIKGSVNNE